MQERLENLLALSRSPSWEQRCRAAIALAGFQTGEAAAAMRTLLHDQENTAPIEEAVRALLNRKDAYGADLVLEAVATGDDEVVDHLLHFISHELTRPELYGFSNLVESRFMVGGPLVREGAAEVLDYFHWKPRRPESHGSA